MNFLLMSLHLGIGKKFTSVNEKWGITKFPVPRDGCYDCYPTVLKA
jgi:hypothetical protein